jgi:hypothetical protein
MIERFVMDKEKMTTLNGDRKYSYRVYKAVADYRGLLLDDCVMDNIDACSKDEVLGDFLEWEGIIGYAGAILSIVKA